MSLHKNMIRTYIPGNPGTPSTPGSLGNEPYCTTEAVGSVDNPPIGQTGYDYGSDTGGSAVPNTNPPYTAPDAPPAEETEYVTTCYPASEPETGTPGIPPTAGQIITGLNIGWNSWSRSVDQIDTDRYLRYTMANGVTGVFIGVSTHGVEGQQIASFKHGIIVDLTGIHIYESGVVVQTIRDSHSSESYIRIVRQIDNSIVYVVTTGTQTIVHVRGAATQSKLMPLYAYAYIYQSGDVVISNEIKTGEVLFGAG